MLLGKEDLTTPVGIAGYPTESLDGSVWSLVDKFMISKDHAREFIPAPYSAYEDTIMKLQSATIVPHQSASGIVIVTLNYSPGESGGSGSSSPTSTHKGGDEEITTDQDWREVPIDDPALITARFLTEKTRDAKKLEGTKTLGIGGIEYRFSEYITDFVWSENNIMASGIGKNGAPPGLAGAVTTKWILASVSISSDGVSLEEVEGPDETTISAFSELTKRTQIWRYSSVGWGIQE